VLLARFRLSTITATTTRNTQKKFTQPGIPDSPSARPVMSRFWITTRMISPKPSVTIAR